MKLRLLDNKSRYLLAEEFRGKGHEINVDPHLNDFQRVVDTTCIYRIVDKAMEMYDGRAVESDGWLAPRIHASLRLTRREASDRRIWNYLGVVELHQYVRWRWSAQGAPPEDRFVGPDAKQALARLWWGAELTRNGTSYLPTVLAFTMQDIPNTWLRFNLFHHRPAAIASVNYLAKHKDGKPASGRIVNRLGQAINIALSATSLDAIAPNVVGDRLAYEEWMGETPDDTQMIRDMPIGPDDGDVPVESLQAIEQFIRKIDAAIGN